MKKIYIVEDDIDISELIQYLLTDVGFEVSACSNLTDFRVQMDTHLPDLILLDIMLPDGNGQDLCRQMKLDAETLHIPILLMSAHANGRAIAKEACADDFISKPFDINELTAKVQQCFI